MDVPDLKRTWPAIQFKIVLFPAPGFPIAIIEAWIGCWILLGICMEGRRKNAKKEF